MSRKRLIHVGLAMLLLTVTICAPAQPHAQTQQFAVMITDPERDGLEVRKGMTVKGTASIPSGYHLWVLARRSDFDGVWWPQGEGKIDPTTKEWKASVTFGEAQDIGWDFEIAAIVVDQEGHIKLREYRTKAMKENVWNPIEVPLSAATPKIRTVKKIAHN
jgi:hypothetical protein